MNFRWLLILLSALFFGGCKLSDRDLLAPSESKTEIPVKIAKWYNNHAGAITITYDSGGPHFPEDRITQELVIQNNLTMDYELITSGLLEDTAKLNYMKNFMLPNGFGFFGHGHKHIFHDDLPYEEALNSFKLCYETMLTAGIKPVSYAYPEGGGYHLRTRKALKDAGFLSGRKFEQLDHSDPYIVPDSVLEPKEWFALPCLVMQSYDYDGCYVCINNTEELIPFLKNTIKKKAWLIITYHAIGIKEAYGFYDVPEFETDLQAIRSMDLWCAHFSDATLYVYERKSASAFAELINDTDGFPKEIRLKLSDGLPNDFYNQPLTLIFDIPEEWLHKDLILKGLDEEKIIKSDKQQIQISIPPDESKYSLKLK